MKPEECPLCWSFYCTCWQRSASVGRNAERQDNEDWLGPEDEHAVAAKRTDAPKEVP